MKQGIISIIAVCIGCLLVQNVCASNRVVVVPLGAKGYEPQSPLIIPAAEFRTGAFHNPTRYIDGYVTGIDNEMCIAIAPAYLPDGVTVTKVTVIARDSDSSWGISVKLFRTSIGIPIETPSEMSTMLTDGSHSSDREFTDTTINNAVIDKKSYAYHTQIGLLSTNSVNLRVYAVKIYYQK